MSHTAFRYKWTEALSVGDDQIDEDHRQIFTLLNRLQNDLLPGADPLAAAKVLVDLFANFAAHFRREEELMERLQHPYLVGHKAELDMLITEVHALHDEFVSGEATLYTKVSTFLVERVIPHILTADVRISRPEGPAREASFRSASLERLIRWDNRSLSSQADTPSAPLRQASVNDRLQPV